MTTGEPTHDKALFVTTRWTLVLSAQRRSSAASEQALADLCQAYWYPLYAYVRRRRSSREDAEDLTQAFFERLLEKNGLDGVERGRGRFRAFLLASLKHFLANDWDRQTRQKRGGTAVHLSLDWTAAEERFSLEPPDSRSPDLLFDREWAIALLERVVGDLARECEQQGRGPLFAQIRGYLAVGEQAIPYATAAQALGMDEGAVRVAVHRLRKRYRDLLRAQIADTLSDPGQVEEELRSLHAALSH